MVAEDLFVNLRAVEMTEADFADDGVDGLDNFDPAAVAEREDEDEAGVFARGLDALVELFANVFGKVGKAADGLEPPNSPAALTTSRTDSAPARWPWTRTMFLALAQRPLPSMMMAMCLGILPNL
jgi:hypothetical protein